MNTSSNRISPMLKLFGVLIPVIIVVATIILNTAFRQSLFLMGVNNVYNLQSADATILKVIQNLFSLLGNPIIVVAVLAIQLLFVKQRVRSLVHITFLTGSLYFTFIFKQLFQQPRPFWYNAKINIFQWFCPLDFGNPSGHSFIVITLYQPILSDFIGVSSKKILIWVWVIIAAFVMLSRMYLGAHSLDQIIFGGLLGLALLVIYKYKLRELLHEMIAVLLAQRSKTFFAICNTIIFAIYLSLPIAIYYINLDTRPVDADNLAQINIKCSKSLTSQSMKAKSFSDSSMGFVALGFMYGFIMLKNTKRQDALYLVGHWQFKSKEAVAYWVLALIIVVGMPTAILALVIPNVVNVSIVKFLCISLGATYGAFAFVYVMSVIQNRYELIEYNDGHENQ